MDIVLKLRELRKMRKLTQREVSRLTGISEKTISSLETGSRIDGLKIRQLRKLLAVYGVNERQFFGRELESVLDFWAVTQRDKAVVHLAEEMEQLPLSIQRSLFEKFQLLVDTAYDVHAMEPHPSSTHPAAASDWQMLTSRN
ncbi:MAG TPA: helix-turn-helix transcriptional regulator [Thermoanaerobaculia bacterium]|nr:helix-turn-helix transcriptional regulator [Thermoanaerobaculia bacterium]